MRHIGHRDDGWDEMCVNGGSGNSGELHDFGQQQRTGTVAKAKANAVQGLPELIEIATGKHFKDNDGEKHRWDAKYGWYRYDSRFALPVYRNDGEIERYNVFHASMLIRHDNDGKLYLYDILNVKKEKETSNPLEP